MSVILCYLGSYTCVPQGPVQRGVYSALRASCSRSGGVCRPVHLATTLEKQQESLIRCVTGKCSNVVSKKTQVWCFVCSSWFSSVLLVLCLSVSPGVKKTVLAAEVLGQLAPDAKRVTVWSAGLVLWMHHVTMVSLQLWQQNINVHVLWCSDVTWSCALLRSVSSWGFLRNGQVQPPLWEEALPPVLLPYLSDEWMRIQPAPYTSFSFNLSVKKKEKNEYDTVLIIYKELTLSFICDTHHQDTDLCNFVQLLSFSSDC